MRVALVIADTRLPPRALWQELLDEADLVVAADGGANRAFEKDVKVDWLIGDLDGALPSTLARLQKGRVKKIEDPYSTDLEKVMRFLKDRGVGRVSIIGAIGGRLDHTLGTLAVLADWGRVLDVRVIDEHFTTTLVKKKATIHAPEGTMVSLIAPGGASGVTTRGFRYELKDRALPFSSLGIHNEVRTNPAEVRVKKGTLFLMQAHYIKRHH
jgi:thiamine pyrophosphokinase